MAKFKKSVSRKLNSGEIGQEVRTKIRYKKTPIKTETKGSFWQKWFRSKWFKRMK